MDRCSDPSLVKTLISTSEYQRLLHIEKKYLDLEQGLGVNQKINQTHQRSEGFKNLEQHLPTSSASDQIGGGEITNFLKRLPDLTFDFLLDKGIYALESATSSSTGSRIPGSVKQQFTDYLRKTLIERFGIPSVSNEGNKLLYYTTFINIFKKLLVQYFIIFF